MGLTPDIDRSEVEPRMLWETTMWSLFGLLLQPLLHSRAVSEPISGFDVVLIWAEADDCGCDATLQRTVDARIKYCGVSQACLEIDVLSETPNAGKCWLPGTNCAVASKSCEFEIEVEVTVHSTCCCAPGSNGANVHVTVHGCDFVASGVANREVFKINQAQPCIEDPWESEFMHVSVSCNKPCGDIDTNGEYPNADATVVWMFKCDACEKK
jgi:hypothetical protein